MIILPAHKAVFVSTPKCATTSMFQVLQEKAGGYHAAGPEWKNGGYHRTDIPAEFREWFTFSISRHPCGRAVSFWRDSVRRKYDWTKEPRARTLATFAKWLCRANPRTISLKPQHIHLEGVRIDRMLRFEQINEEVLTLPFWDARWKLPHLNRTVGPPWSAVVTPSIRRNIQTWAGKDFDLYGYKR